MNDKKTCLSGAPDFTFEISQRGDIFPQADDSTVEI